MNIYDNLDKRIEISIRVVISFVILVPTAFVFWFYFYLGLKPSGDPASWGQFGDYIGGVLNPIIAFSAFYWLATSVQMQKKELSETKDALLKSTEAQQQHAKTVLASLRIQSLNIRVEALTSEIEAVRAHLNMVLGQISVNGRQYNVLNMTGQNLPVDTVLPEIIGRIEDLVSQRALLIATIKELVLDNAS
jgi:hypothetical protein